WVAAGGPAADPLIDECPRAEGGEGEALGPAGLGGPPFDPPASPGAPTNALVFVGVVELLSGLDEGAVAWALTGGAVALEVGGVVVPDVVGAVLAVVGGVVAAVVGGTVLSVVGGSLGGSGASGEGGEGGSGATVGNVGRSRGGRG